MFNILMVGGVFFIFTSVVLAYVVEAYFKKLNTKVLGGLLFLNFFLSMFLSYKMFTTMIWYNYDNKDVATKGIFFKDTLILSEHRLIGSSDYVIFKIDKYSRSDRQLEVINVIVNDNKSKDIINEQ